MTGANRTVLETKCGFDSAGLLKKIIMGLPEQQQKMGGHWEDREGPSFYGEGGWDQKKENEFTYVM